MNRVRLRFEEALRRLGAVADESTVDRLWRDIETAYAGRPFHNLSHVRSMLEFCRPADSPELDLAIIYHDLVCIPGAGDNEELSSNVCANQLCPLGIEASSLTLIHRLIMITDGHRLSGHDDSYDLETWIHDADLIGFATNGEVGRRQILEEYSCLSTPAYIAGRIEFLKRFRRRKPFYHRPENKIHEAAAIAAIDREIEWLESGAYIAECGVR